MNNGLLEALLDGGLSNMDARIALQIFEEFDSHETFRRLRAEGWPDGRVRSQRKMAALCRVDERTIRRRLAQEKNLGATDLSAALAADRTPPDL